jgi:hypothetical protein
MDEQERDYLRQQIRELQQANSRWKALAIICVSILAFVFVAGGATVLSGGMLMSRRMHMEALRARDAEMEARMEAEEAQMQADRARQAEMEARMQAAEAAKGDKR